MTTLRCGYDRFLALMQPGARHRRGRDFIVRAVGSRRAAAQYATAQEAEVVRFLRKLQSSPEKLKDHVTW
jgi:cytochrome P450